MSMKLASWVSSQTFPQNNSAIGHQPGERLESDLVSIQNQMCLLCHILDTEISSTRLSIFG